MRRNLFLKNSKKANFETKPKYILNMQERLRKITIQEPVIIFVRTRISMQIRQTKKNAKSVQITAKLVRMLHTSVLHVHLQIFSIQNQKNV